MMALVLVLLMKRLLLALLLIGCLCSLGACMFMGSDDREFYGKGWLNPKELDRAPAVPMAIRPAANDAPVGGVVPSATDSGEWSTPPPFSSDGR